MLRLSIDTGNAAFQPDPRVELSRILLKFVQEQLSPDAPANDTFALPLSDLNGNKVGNVSLQHTRTTAICEECGEECDPDEVHDGTCILCGDPYD